MNATFRASSWIVTPCLAAMAVAYLALTWLPSRRAIQQWRGQVQAEQQVVAGATELSAKLVAMQQELRQTEAVVAQWEKTAPGKRDIPAMFGQINALAKEAGLSISRFDPQPALIHEKLQEMPIAVVCSGAFADLFQFLRGIEGLPATMWVESIRLEKGVQNAKDVRCEVSLAIFSNNQHISDYARHSE
jgi:Tfp pilus assembly protein PilO